ncbi:YqhA family protein [Nonomuraea thailandensis]
MSAKPLFGQGSARPKSLGYLMFASRWLQVPLYLGLIVAQAVYVYQFALELWHLIETVFLHGDAPAAAGAPRPRSWSCSRCWPSSTW